MRVVWCGFALGIIALQQQASLPGWQTMLALAVLTALAFAWALYARRRPRARQPHPASGPRTPTFDPRVASGWLAVSIAAVCAGFGYATWRAHARLAEALPAAWQSREIDVTGHIASLPTYDAQGARFLFHVDSYDEPRANEHWPRTIQLTWIPARGGHGSRDGRTQNERTSHANPPPQDARDGQRAQDTENPQNTAQISPDAAQGVQDAQTNDTFSRHSAANAPLIQAHVALPPGNARNDYDAQANDTLSEHAAANAPPIQAHAPLSPGNVQNDQAAQANNAFSEHPAANAPPIQAHVALPSGSARNDQAAQANNAFSEHAAANAPPIQTHTAPPPADAAQATQASQAKNPLSPAHPGLPALEPGARWRLPVRLKRPHGNGNFGLRDAEIALLARDVRAMGYVSAPERALRLEGDAHGMGTHIERARARARARIDAVLADAPHRGIVIALANGAQDAIADADWQLLRRSGTSHLVAVSGLHVALVAGLAGWALGALWRRARWRGGSGPLTVPAQTVTLAGAVCAAVGYAALAGFNVPVQRALWMLIVAAVALASRRRVARSQILAWALGLVLLYDPWAVSAAGFWLSFGAVGAILCAVSGTVRAHRRKGRDDPAQNHAFDPSILDTSLVSVCGADGEPVPAHRMHHEIQGGNDDSPIDAAQIGLSASSALAASLGDKYSANRHANDNAPDNDVNHHANNVAARDDATNSAATSNPSHKIHEIHDANDNGDMGARRIGLSVSAALTASLNGRCSSANHHANDNATDTNINHHANNVAARDDATNSAATSDPSHKIHEIHDANDNGDMGARRIGRSVPAALTASLNGRCSSANHHANDNATDTNINRHANNGTIRNATTSNTPVSPPLPTRKQNQTPARSHQRAPRAGQRPFSRIASSARDGLRVQWAVTLALAPLSAYWFAQIPLVGPLANALAIPCVSLLITPLVLAGVALPGWPGALALRAAHALLEWLMRALAFVSSPSWAVLTLPQPGAWALICAAAGVAWCLAPRGWPLRWAAPFMWLPLLLPGLSGQLSAPAPPYGAFRLTALDIGQGTSVLVETARHALLFDAGPGAESTHAGERIVVPYLQTHGVTRLDALVISHDDADHAGGAPAVLDAIEVRQLVAGIAPTHALWMRARAAGAQTVRCAAGQRWQWDGVRFDVLWPDPGPLAGNTNRHSCVLRVSTLPSSAARGNTDNGADNNANSRANNHANNGVSHNAHSNMRDNAFLNAHDNVRAHADERADDANNRANDDTDADADNGANVSANHRTDGGANTHVENSANINANNGINNGTDNSTNKRTDNRANNGAHHPILPANANASERMNRSAQNNAPDNARAATNNAHNEQQNIADGNAPDGLAALLTADIEAPVERALLERSRAALRAQVLVVPHHGSRTSSTEPFVDAVGPLVAIFQVGYLNRFHHPNASVFARYTARGIALARSDDDGAVQIDARDGTLVVSSYRTVRRRYWMDAPSP